MVRSGGEKLVRLEKGIEHLLDAYHSGYKVRTKEICRAYCASRSWADARLSDSVSHVYVTPRGADALARHLDDVDTLLPGNLYNVHELDAIVSDTVASQRSKVLWLPGHARSQSDAKKLEDLARAVDYAKNANERFDAQARLVEKAPKLVKQALSEAISLVLTLTPNRKDNPRYNRADHAWLPVDGATPSGWMHFVGMGARTAADMTDYGDSAEEVARNIWDAGMVRLEVPTPGGGVRVMYIPDPHPDSIPDGAVRLCVTVPVDMISY